MLANAGEEAVDARVRRRLRELRHDQALTLQQVAERADLDVSTLSRLESGKRRLALDHLPALARGLGVSVDALLGVETPEDPRVREPSRSYDGLTLWPLTRRGPAAGIQAYRIRISPRRRKPPSPLPVHDGYDWFYVLQGRLRLLLGDQDLAFGPGEALEFSTRTPHWFGAVDGAVELIAILGSSGERSHLHG